MSTPRRPARGNYLFAVLTVGLGLVLRVPVWSVLGTTVPFLTFFPAVMLSAWRGGFGPGLLTTSVSLLVADYALIEPAGSLWIARTSDWVATLLFGGVGTFLSWAAGEMRRARQQERRLRVLSELTLSGIHDAVIAVDGRSRITFMNPVAEQLTGRLFSEVQSHPIEDVFEVVDERSARLRAVLRDGVAQTLAQNELRASDGRQVPIEHSIAPVRDEHGSMAGAVVMFRDITERLQAERDVRAVQERLRSMLESITDAFLSVDTEWKFTYLNAAAEQVLGRNRDDLLGRILWDEFPETRGTISEESLRTAVAERRSIRFEAWYEAFGKWFEINSYPTDLGGLSMFFRDVTAWKTAEMRDAFLVTLDDAVRPLTDSWEITQTAARMLGQHMKVNRCAYADVEPDEDTFNLTGDFNDGVPSIVGRYAFAQFGADCLRMMRAAVPFVVQDTETDSRTELVRASYRATMIRSVICVPLHKGGRFAGAMAVHQIVPRRWHAHEVELVQLVANRCWESIERTRVSRELQEREQRFRFLAESIPQMVWTATPEGLLDYVNDRGVGYFGTTPDAVRGVGWLTYVHPDDQEATVDRWRASLASGAAYETEFRIKRGSDGSWRWHLVRALAMRGVDGSVQQWFGTCTDIEDQKATEAELMLANRGLEEFAYVASHDLQEPMRMVNSYTELLLRRIGPQSDPNLRQFGEYVQSGVKRMEKLIRDMLTYSRTMHTASQPEQKPASLETALVQALSLVETRIAETGAVIEHEDELPLVFADESQIVHVFQNLLSNALKYSCPSRPPHVQIKAARRDGSWVVSVRDNGIGFDQRYAEQVFGLFKRLHARGEYSGTGLGLAICKRIVERYGGRMWAESELGTGSTFYFTLPSVI